MGRVHESACDDCERPHTLRKESYLSADTLGRDWDAYEIFFVDMREGYPGGNVNRRDRGYFVAQVV